MSEDSDDELTKRKVEKRVREEHETEMWKKMYYEATDGTKTSQLHEARMWKRKFYEVTGSRYECPLCNKYMCDNCIVDCEECKTKICDNCTSFCKFNSPRCLTRLCHKCSDAGIIPYEQRMCKEHR